jgi:RNA polymerase sigma-70 factor (ECF subfamily)
MPSCPRALLRQPNAEGTFESELVPKPCASASSPTMRSLGSAHVATAAADVEPSDTALVEAARAGHTEAREELFKRHMSQILGISRRLLAGQEGADDVAQDALVDAIGHLDALTNPQAFTSWMASIVVRRALGHLRNGRLLLRLGLRSPTPLDLETLISPGAPTDVVIELQAVRAALDCLPEQERMVLILRRVGGLRLSEIGRRMNVSLATVKRRLAAAEDRFAACQHPLERIAGYAGRRAPAPAR